MILFGGLKVAVKNIYIYLSIYIFFQNYIEYDSIDGESELEFINFLLLDDVILVYIEAINA